jgi:NAD(P)H-hydrate epimerase
MQHIKTSDTKKIKTLFKDFNLPKPNSHKGQNGKVLIIGGSSLFHAASIWAAEVASHFVDIVHYSSTKENNEIITSMKKKFINGIVIPHKELEHYVKEDNAVLVGPGMMRTKKYPVSSIQYSVLRDLEGIKDEGEYTYQLTKYLIKSYPDKKFVFDAGSLQMMDPEWLKLLETPAIITPHQIEFEQLFGINLHNLPVKEKAEHIQETAEKYHVTILLKAIVDIISDGGETYIIEGGNAGLTKGGTGDVLGGLCVSFFAKESSLQSALYASILLKRTADRLFKTKGYWYNIDNIIEEIPHEFKSII